MKRNQVSARGYNGNHILATELDGKRQEILIEAVPGLRCWGPLPMPTPSGCEA